MTIDWEGAYLSPEGLDTLDAMREKLGPDVPLTHFVSAGYFTKPEVDTTLQRTLTEQVRKGDEFAVHLHAWKSLAVATGIEPKLSPSFLSGTDKLLEFEDDRGFDVDLDAYSVVDLRALVKKSRQLLESTKLPVSKSFRAAGYLATPKVLQAIHDEGFTIDSSATDYRQLDERKDEFLPQRVQGIWPNIDTASQPRHVKVQGGQLVEIPIAAFADYSPTPEIVKIFEAAHAKLVKTPTRDVFVVLGFHQENAADVAAPIVESIAAIRANKDIADDLAFTTVEHVAALARTTLAESAK